MQGRKTSVPALDIDAYAQRVVPVLITILSTPTRLRLRLSHGALAARLGKLQRFFCRLLLEFVGSGSSTTGRPRKG